MKKKVNTYYLTSLSVLCAILLIMTYTPLGYIPLGLLSITLIPIPVAIGANFLGAKAGATLGLVFGLTSFNGALRASTGLFLILVQSSVVGTFILCVVPRVLMGYFAGLAFTWLYEKKKWYNTSIVVGSFLAPALNTVFFLSFLAILFRGDLEAMAISNSISLFTLIIGMAGINAVCEIFACVLISSGVTKVLLQTARRIPSSS